MNTVLLLIDPQNDFCSPEGALFVAGSPEDCKRTAKFIDTFQHKLDSICITLDCHPSYHIAHPVFWKNSEEKHPQPFTIIKHTDVLNGIWTPVDQAMYQRAKNYVLALESAGKYKLTIWRPHCLLGSCGAAVEKSILDAAHRWENETIGRSIDFYNKSTSSATEHYSAVQAEVPDPEDPATRTNFMLIDRLKNADMIFIAGEALSHCVANTVRDLLAYIPAEKMTLLTNCTSSINGYEQQSARFLHTFSDKGMKIRDTSEIFL